MYVHDMMSESLNGLQCFTYLGRKIKKKITSLRHTYSVLPLRLVVSWLSISQNRDLYCCVHCHISRDRTKLAIGKHSADFMDQSVCEWMNRNMKFRMLYFAVVEPSFWSCCPEKRLSKHWTGKNKLVLVTFSYQVNVWPMLSLSTC